MLKRKNALLLLSFLFIPWIGHIAIPHAVAGDHEEKLGTQTLTIEATQKNYKTKPQGVYTPISLKNNDEDTHSSPMISSYTIGPEDTLDITVFEEKDLSGKFKVAPDGTVAMPLVGAISVQDKTLREAETIIAEAYKKGYLKDPKVSIEIEETRPFFILGEVRRPGSYNYIGNMNILQAVAISGGFTYRANKDKIEIIRGDNKNPSQYDVNTNTIIHAGDIIFVKERFF